MNTAVRVAVRVGLDLGHTMLGVRDGFRGLVDGNFMSGEVSRYFAPAQPFRFLGPTPPAN
jgi:6-phosphofructokinase